MSTWKMTRQIQQMMNRAISSNLMDVKPTLSGKHTLSKGAQNTGSSSKLSMKRGLEVLSKHSVKNNKPTSSKNTECEASNQNTSGTIKPRFFLPSMWRSQDNGMLSLLRKGGAIGRSKLEGIESI